MQSQEHLSSTPGSKSSRLAKPALAVIAAMLSTVSAVSAAPPERSSEGPWVKGRVLVMPKAGLSDAELGKIVGGHGARARKLTSHGLYAVEVPPNISERALAALLAHNPHFKFAELDRIVATDLLPNDPYYGTQWHLPKIGGPEAWNVTQGTGITIAILDSGVDAAHPDLQGRLVPGFNFVDGNTNTADVHGHGTKVAGAAAAASNNGNGVASVAGQAKVMPIRVSDSSGYATWSAMAQGLTFAANNGAKVANMSFNGVAGSSSVLSAAKYMRDKGGLSFVSAGNSNLDPGYANTDLMVIVAATTSTDTKASFSNFGDHVHLAAPGAGIYSTTNGGGYASVSGTSFAAPVTAGVGALVMAANPLLSNAQVEKILFATAVDLGTAGRDVYFGHGRVDAAAAVNLAMATAGTVVAADAQPPSVSISSPGDSVTVSGITAVNVSAADNVGVVKAELLVNGALFATDTTAPFAFNWDTKTVANGMANLSVRAYDAAGNSGQSVTVAVNVANTVTVSVADTTAPTATISNPASGAKVSGTVQVTATGSDNAGTSGLKMSLFINGTQVATSSGTSTLKYGWNTRKYAAGSYTMRVDAIDGAGNKSSSSVAVTR